MCMTKNSDNRVFTRSVKITGMRANSAQGPPSQRGPPGTAGSAREAALVPEAQANLCFSSTGHASPIASQPRKSEISQNAFRHS